MLLKKFSMLALTVMSAACGSDALYTIDGMHIHADAGLEGVPSKAELASYIGEFQERTGLKALPTTLVFVRDINDCVTEGCDGKTALGAGYMRVEIKPCLAATSLGHELVHFGFYKKGGLEASDAGHISPLFDHIDYDLRDELCE